jgi:hypothetical protein
MLIISRSLGTNRTPWASCVCCLQHNNPKAGNRLWYDAFTTMRFPFNRVNVDDQFPVLLRLGREILYKAQCKIKFKCHFKSGKELLNFLNDYPHYEPVLGDQYRNTIDPDRPYYFLGYEFSSARPLNVSIPGSLNTRIKSWFRTENDPTWEEFINSLNLWSDEKCN